MWQSIREPCPVTYVNRDERTDKEMNEFSITEMGRRARQLREKRHMTQEALAEAVGVDRKQISRLGNGKVLLQADTLVRIAGVLGVTTDRLLLGQSPKEEDGQYHIILPSEFAQRLTDDMERLIHIIHHTDGTK